MTLESTPKDIAAAKKIAKECPDGTIHAAYISGLLADRQWVLQEIADTIVNSSGAIELLLELLAERIRRGPQ